MRSLAFAAVALVLVASAPSASAQPSSLAAELICHIDRPGAADGPRSPLWDQGLRDLREFGDGGIIQGREARDLVAFTFDDGPRVETSPKVLDALDRYDIPATFFVVGWRFAGTTRDQPANLKILHDMVARGHHIGNHTFRHINLAAAAPPAMRKDIDRASRALLEVLGYMPHAFRPPFGAMNARSRMYLSQQGFTELRWSIDTDDYLVKRSAALRQRTVKAILAARGGIVLMHDTKEVTAAAIAGILDDLEAESCRRLDRGEPIITPVSLHYFIRNRDGSARPIPARVAARTQRYRDNLPARCQARRDRRDKPRPGRRGRPAKTR